MNLTRQFNEKVIFKSFKDFVNKKIKDFIEQNDKNGDQKFKKYTQPLKM